MAKFGLQSTRGYIYVTYNHQNQRFAVSTRLQSEDLFNPAEKALNLRHPDFTTAKRVVDLITNNIITAVQKVMTAGYEPAVNLVKIEYQNILADFDPSDSGEKNPDFYESWNEFIGIKSSEMRYNGFRNYDQLYSLLKGF